MFYNTSCNDMSATHAAIGHRPWSIRVQINRMTSWETCFLCFVQHGTQFWKCLQDNFRLNKWKTHKSFSRSNLQRQKWRNRDKKSSWQLNYKKFSQQLPNICVITTRDSLFCKTFSPFFCLIEQVKTLKNFSKKLYISKIKQKRRGEDKK